MLTPFYVHHENHEWLCILIIQPIEVNVMGGGGGSGYTSTKLLLVQPHNYGQIKVVSLIECKFSRLPEKCLMCGAMKE